MQTTFTLNLGSLLNLQLAIQHLNFQDIDILNEPKIITKSGPQATTQESEDCALEQSVPCSLSIKPGARVVPDGVCVERNLTHPALEETVKHIHVRPHEAIILAVKTDIHNAAITLVFKAKGDNSIHCLHNAVLHEQIFIIALILIIGIHLGIIFLFKHSKHIFCLSALVPEHFFTKTGKIGKRCFQ